MRHNTFFVIYVPFLLPIHSISIFVIIFFLLSPLFVLFFFAFSVTFVNCSKIISLRSMVKLSMEYPTEIATKAFSIASVIVLLIN